MQVLRENNIPAVDIHDEERTCLLGLVTECLYPCLAGLHILMVTVPEEHGTAQVLEKHPANVTHTTHVLHRHLYLLLKRCAGDTCTSIQKYKHPTSMQQSKLQNIFMGTLGDVQKLSSLIRACRVPPTFLLNFYTATPATIPLIYLI